MSQSEHPARSAGSETPPVPDAAWNYAKEALRRALLAPIKAFRVAYLPLLMVYFAYGALGLVAVAQGFWEKKGLSLSPAELAHLGVWLALPWAIKMVFGELVDTVAILGSRRPVYVFLGAALGAASLVLMAGAAGGCVWPWNGAASVVGGSSGESGVLVGRISSIGGTSLTSGTLLSGPNTVTRSV